MDLLDLMLHPHKAIQRFSPLRKDLSRGQENELEFLFGRVRKGEHRIKIVGERSYESHDPVVRAVYGGDAASLPRTVDLLVKRTPGSVVLPRSRGELLDLLRFAKANNIPITPRAGGTSGYGGAVPAEGGIVADLRAFNKVLAVDKARGEVRVEAGVNWLDLEAALSAEGLAVRCYPTSAPFATVGGWVAMGGGGVGSYQFGTIRDSLVEAVVLTPDGAVETFRGQDLDLVESCEGTTGFILEVVLKVRPSTRIVPVAAAFDDIERAHAYINAFGVLEVYSVHILGPEFVELKQEAAGSRALPKHKFIVLTALHDTTSAGGRAKLQELCQLAGGEWVKDAGAQWEWDTRFQHVNFKRFGPTLVAAEAIAPRRRLAEAWTAGQRALRAPEWCMWAIATSQDEFDLIGYVLADERMPAYPLAAGSSLAFIDAVKELGGRAYSPGLLLAGESKHILGRDRIKRLRRWKKQRDKAEIMNPGKVLPARVKGAPVIPITLALGPAELPLKLMRGRFDHRRNSTTEPSNRAVRAVAGRRLSPRLARLGDDLYKCSRAGHTNRVGDLHREVRFETQLPRGIVRAAQVLLEGRVLPGPQLVVHALSLPCVPTYDRFSQNGTPIFEAIEAVREASQRVAGLDPRVSAIVERLETTGNVFGKPKDERGAWVPGVPPAGPDTTALLLAGDVGAYERGADATAAFRVLTNAGFGFSVLGADEPHAGTVPYRLGAFDAARISTGALAEAALEEGTGNRPGLLVTLSSEDADVFRRRLPDLLAGSEVAWTPRVVTFVEMVASLVADKRLTFNEVGEALALTLVHSPFATAEERKAAEAVAKALPGLQVKVHDPGAGLLPDLAFQLTHPEDATRHAKAALEGVNGKVLVACTDLAYVLGKAKVDVVTLPALVAERMKARGGGVALAAPIAKAAPPAFREMEIPEGAFRVELVKEKAAIPVFPDESILDAAEKLGFEDLPSDCRSGSCVTCCGRWEGTPADQKEGQVLSAEEQTRFVLTCIAKPRGPVKVWTSEKP